MNANCLSFQGLFMFIHMHADSSLDLESDTRYQSHQTSQLNAAISVLN